MNVTTLALLSGILFFLVLSVPYFLKSTGRKRVPLEERLFMHEQRIEKIIQGIVWSETKYGKFFGAHLYPYMFSNRPFLEKLSKFLGFDFNEWKEKIKEAGLSKTITPEEMLSMKILGLAGMLFFFVTGAMFGMNVLLFVLGLTCYLLGSMFSQSYVNRKLLEKRMSIEYELPGFLDILSSVVDSGLPIQQAIDKVSIRMKGALADEFRAVMVETKNGGRWEQAMENMSFRNNVDMLSDTVSDVLIAYSKGAPIAEVLKSEAYVMRQAKNAKVMERTRGLSIKMMIPLALFGFLPLMVLVLGPLVIQVMGQLG